MFTPKVLVKVSNVMSLEDKIRIIRSYEKLKTPEEKELFVSQHRQVANIIKNKDKIISQKWLMEIKVEAAKKKLNGHMRLEDEFVKVSFLESIIFEWYQRYRNTVSNKEITLQCFRERVEIAKEILNFKVFVLSDPWIINLHLTCSRGIAKDVDKNWSLNLKDIIRYVLVKRGISRETAGSKYGIYFTDIEPEEQHPQESLQPREELEQSKLIDIDKQVCESSENNQSENERIQECSGNGDTSHKESLENDQLLEKSNEPISPEHDKAEVCELMENHKDFLVYLVHDGNDSTSAEKPLDQGELLDDNKEALTYLNLHTSMKDNVEKFEFLKTSQDALMHLSPLREYLMSQNNTIALELLCQMEATLIKPETH